MKTEMYEERAFNKDQLKYGLKINFISLFMFIAVMIFSYVYCIFTEINFIGLFANVIIFNIFLLFILYRTIGSIIDLL